MKIYDNIVQLVGNTPIVKLNNIININGLEADIYGKIESFNPSGSVKDRIAKAMIEDAITSGKINQETTIIEPTSGNTGIGIASIASQKGLKTILVMPESMSMERRLLLKAYGAQLVLTPATKGMKGAIERANELNSEIANSVILSQFTNPANPNIHYQTTGPEIFEAFDGNVDILIAGVGTGGTVSGTGKYLKEKITNFKVIAVEPTKSPFLSEGVAGPHGIQGIGAGFKPDTLNIDVIDEIIKVADEDAYASAKLLATTEGILCGISSGAALFAAMQVAQRKENKGKKIVVILPDSGERYLSTPLFN